MLSMTTDFESDTGDPLADLADIDHAGFTHVHWCHHWCDDYAYGREEIDTIAARLREHRLMLRDLHASAGDKLSWTSPNLLTRQGGTALVANRLDMAVRLGADVIILHANLPPADHADFPACWDAARLSLDELAASARTRGVRIALENGHCGHIARLLESYGSDFLGLCYDSGHGNIQGDLDWLDHLKDRLIAIHLHDNDGRRDLHRLPFGGTVDWSRVTKLIAASSYKKGVTCEATMNHEGIPSRADWLARAHQACTTLQRMIGND